MTGTLFGPEVGRAVSPEFRIDRRYLHFYFPPLGEMTAVCLRVDGRPVCAQRLRPSQRATAGAAWDVGAYRGRTGRFEVIDRHMVNLPAGEPDRRLSRRRQVALLAAGRAVQGFGHGSRRRCPTVPRKYKPGSDVKFKEDLSSDYKEKYRPQFHFTCNHGSMNDPNGLLYYEGEYHLFMQHAGWGHAVSKDLVHWAQLEHALSDRQFRRLLVGLGGGRLEQHLRLPDRPGKAAGRRLRLGATSSTSSIRRSVTASKCSRMAYSNDRGRTWTKYAGNPGDRRAGPRSEDVLARADEELAAGADAMSAGPGLLRLHRLETLEEGRRGPARQRVPRPVRAARGSASRRRRNGSPSPATAPTGSAALTAAITRRRPTA